VDASRISTGQESFNNRPIPVHWSGTIVLEADCHPLAGCFRGMISADTSLDIFLHFAKCYLHAFPMCLAYTIVSANEGSQ
jgi:hypothetical protein